MIIGVEGVSCAGKTELARELARALDDPLVIACYYHAAPDPALLPDPIANSVAEQLAALGTLLEVEDLRRRRADEALRQGQDVIFDRTVDTLLAHTHAVAALRGLPVGCEARQLVTDTQPLLPDLTLLLHTDHTVLAARAKARPGLPQIFYARDFAEHFLGYFQDPLTTRCVRLDSTPPTIELLEPALQLIRRARRPFPCASPGPRPVKGSTA